MKPGDEILIDGALQARVRAIRSRTELQEIAPLMSEAIDRRISGRDVIRAAIVTITGEPLPALLIETTGGWRTGGGSTVDVKLRSEALPC